MQACDLNYRIKYDILPLSLSPSVSLSLANTVSKDGLFVSCQDIRSSEPITSFLFEACTPGHCAHTIKE